MTALSIQPAYPLFTDKEGVPLRNGYIWIGAANLPPQTNPIGVFWDAALTIPAAQPIRTINGYPLNNGTPGRLYVNSDYSVLVQDRAGTLVYSAPTAGERFSDIVITGIDSVSVDYLPAGIGATTRTLQDKLRESFSVKDFGAVGNGIADDTAAIQRAIDHAATIAGTSDYLATGVGVFFPAGDYLISSSLRIPTGGIGLYGNTGRGPRIVTNLGTIDMVVVGDPTDAANTWEVHFENLTFFATAADNTGVVGIRTYRSFLGSVRWCAFENCYDSFVGHRANRWTLHGVRTWQNRTTTIARSSFRFLGSASGTGGGIHITDCELAGGGSLVPSVDAHLLFESCDGAYVCNTHTRDCNHGVKTAPDGSTGKNIIDSLWFVNCYFDENYLYNAHLTGSVGASGRYQVIHFDNCYFRGTGGDSTNCVRIDISNAGGFTGQVFDIAFNGGAMRQASSTAALVRGSSNSFLEVFGASFSNVYFDDNNFGGGATTTGIQSEAETLTVTGCIFGQDINAGTHVIQSNMSGPNSNEPSFVVVGNDFSKSNCTGHPINYTQLLSGTTVQISDNTFPGLGHGVDQIYKLRTLDATTTTVWDFVVPQGRAGQVEARLSGVTSDGGVAATYSWTTGFRRNASGTTLSTGGTSWTAGIAWNPDSLGTVPTADLSGNTLRVRATGPAAETAGAFVVGRTYRIATVGTTDFTLVGAANNNVGTEFVATGVGTGTGTANVVMEWSCAIKLSASR